MTSSSPKSIHRRQEKEPASNTTPPPPETPNSKPQETNNSPYPTTFVQADTSNFKQVVQLLTGSSSPATASSSSIPPIKSTPQKKQGFKLYERRNSLKNGFLMIATNKDHHSSPPPPSHDQNLGFSSPRGLLSPSILDFPSLVLSPRTPPNSSAGGVCKSSLEEASSPLLDGEVKANIAEKTFYLHLSSPPPRTDIVEAPPPRLLPLFPLTSPRASGSSS